MTSEFVDGNANPNHQVDEEELEAQIDDALHRNIDRWGVFSALGVSIVKIV